MNISLIKDIPIVRKPFRQKIQILKIRPILVTDRQGRSWIEYDKEEMIYGR